MSRRFLKWAEAWIAEHIPPGANPDIERYDAKAKRLLMALSAQAADEGFTKSEIADESEHVAPLVLAAVSDRTEFDIDTYHLKSLLARENEDGD